MSTSSFILYISAGVNSKLKKKAKKRQKIPAGGARLIPAGADWNDFFIPLIHCYLILAMSCQLHVVFFKVLFSILAGFKVKAKKIEAIESNVEHTQTPIF